MMQLRHAKTGAEFTRVSTIATRAAERLDRLALGQYLTLRELTAEIGLGLQTLDRYASVPPLSLRRLPGARGAWLYVSIKTAEAARKESGRA